MTIVLERIFDRLPVGFAELQADARADGHSHMARLADEYGSNPVLFHAVFVCHVGGWLAGIGAMTDEPTQMPPTAWRMRRFYVHRKFRRRGVARAIALALLQHLPDEVRTVTVHAGSDDAARFWAAMGFRPVVGQAWSHQAVTSVRSAN